MYFSRALSRLCSKSIDIEFAKQVNENIKSLNSFSIAGDVFISGFTSGLLAFKFPCYVRRNTD